MFIPVSSLFSCLCQSHTTNHLQHYEHLSLFCFCLDPQQLLFSYCKYITVWQRYSKLNEIHFHETQQVFVRIFEDPRIELNQDQLKTELAQKMYTYQM